MGVFVITALGFIFLTSSLVNFVILFATLGIYIGIFDGSQKAYVSEIANPSLKATALGTVATLIGIITLPSSFFAGILWDIFGSASTFAFGATVGSSGLSLFIIHVLKYRRGANTLNNSG